MVVTSYGPLVGSHFLEAFGCLLAPTDVLLWLQLACYEVLESTLPLPSANPCRNASLWEILQLGPSSLFPTHTLPGLGGPTPRSCNGPAVLSGLMWDQARAKRGESSTYKEVRFVMHHGLLCRVKVVTRFKLWPSLQASAGGVQRLVSLWASGCTSIF